MGTYEVYINIKKDSICKSLILSYIRRQLTTFGIIYISTSQVRYLNKAMAEFDASVVMPTNFVFFTVSAILSGIIFYGEFDGLTVLQVKRLEDGSTLSYF